MNISQFVKWSGVAAIASGAFGIINILDVVEVAPWMFLVSNVFSVIYFFGIYLFQKELAGVFGLVAVLIALLGELLIVFVNIFKPSTMIYTNVGLAISFLGVLLIAVAALRAGSFPYWVSLMWLGGPAIMLLAIFLPDLEDTLLKTGGIIFHAGFIGAGLSLWKYSPVNDFSKKEPNTT